MTCRWASAAVATPRCASRDRWPNVTWPGLFGGGILGGIGFTMALFVAGLAVEGEALDAAKIGILFGSMLAAVLGMVWLTMVARKGNPAPASDPAKP